MKYIKHIETGIIGQANKVITGYEKATEEEIKEYILDEAKKEKLKVVKDQFEKIITKGVEYKGNFFKVTEKSLNNMKRKPHCSSQNPDRYKWFPIEGAAIDFKNARGLKAFTTAMFNKYDMLMFQLGDLKYQIKTAESLKALKKLTFVEG